MNEESKDGLKWNVVGYNVLVLVGYTLLFRIVPGGIVLDCAVVGIHCFVGIVTSVVARRWEWFLAALAVLIIGFSTCVTFLAPTWNSH